MNKIELYILDYAAFDMEPLHLIIHSILSSNICQTAKDIIKPLIYLIEQGYLDISYHTGISGEPYEPVKSISEYNLYLYIERNKLDNFEIYPEKGGEYFFKTTEKGYSFVEETESET